MNGSNRSHKYISRKWQNGRWVYEYDYNRNGNRMVNNSLPKTNQVSRTSVTKKSTVPDAYQPNLKPDTLYGKNDKGYTNSDGMFFRGDYESARKQSYEYDLKKANGKAQKQLEEQNYRKSTKRHIDDVKKDIKKGAKKVSSLSKKTINNGKKKVAKFLREAADKFE